MNILDVKEKIEVLSTSLHNMGKTLEKKKLDKDDYKRMKKQVDKIDNIVMGPLNK